MLNRGLDVENSIIYKSKQKIQVATPILIFCIINLIVGFNTGVTKWVKKTVLLIMRPAQVVSVIFISISLIVSKPTDPRFIFNVVLGSQYLFFVFLFEFSKYNVCDFIREIHLINKDITSSNEKKLGALIVTSSVVWWLIKTVLCVIHCNYSSICQLFTLPPLINCAIVIINDGVALVLGLIQGYTYFCLEYFKKQSQESALDVRSLVKLYMSIADCYDKIMPLYGKIVICQLIVNVPKLMIIICTTIMYVKSQEGWLTYIGQGVFLFHIAMQLCGPCIAAEHVNSKYKAIKLIFNSKVAKEQDKEKKAELARFLDYLNSRSFQYKACRVVPVDLRLVTSLISFCTTYLVVIIQFTHLL